MRDVALEPLPDDPAALPTPYVGDDAFARTPPGGINAAVGLTDTSFANDKAYVQPGTGGEFAPGRAQLVSGPADGGAAKMAAPSAGVAPPALVKPNPPYSRTGRSNNQATRLNLYPWFKVPREGLDMNNATVSSLLMAAPADPPEPVATKPAKNHTKERRHD